MVLQAQTISPDFPYSGTWYNYFEGTILEVNDINITLQLEAGEYLIFTDFETPTPDLSADIQLNIDQGNTNNFDVRIFLIQHVIFYLLNLNTKSKVMKSLIYQVKKYYLKIHPLKIIDCSTLGDGLYTITFTLRNGEIVRKKLLINV